MRETFTPSSGHSAIMNERDLKVRSPQPVECRARNYGYQESLSDSRSDSQMGGHKQHYFYTNPNPKQRSTATAENMRECCAYFGSSMANSSKL